MDLKTKIVPLLFLLLGCTMLSAQNQEDRTTTASEKLIFTEQIYFDFAKADLRSSDFPILYQIDSLLRENPARSLRITAHTDAIGKDEANQKLSLNRAQSVTRFFEQRGISMDNVQYAYFGESAPQAANTSDEGRQRNRRAQLEVVEVLSSPSPSLAAPPKTKPTAKSLVRLSGQVLNDSGLPIQAKVVLKSKDFRDSTFTKEDGKYSFEVPDSTVVGLDIFAEGYFFDSKMLRLLRNKSMPLKSVLKKAECGELFPLHKMYFYGDQAVLLPRSKPELKRLLQFMGLNKKLRLEVGGHINKPFVNPKNLSRKDKTLSENRAKMVYTFLTENGIAEDRLSYKGYGNQFMIYPKTRKESEMRLNRRVELKVICKD